LVEKREEKNLLKGLDLVEICLKILEILNMSEIILRD